MYGYEKKDQWEFAWGRTEWKIEKELATTEY